jgi:small subunit ribosomal protein S9
MPRKKAEEKTEEKKVKKTATKNSTTEKAAPKKDSKKSKTTAKTAAKKVETKKAVPKKTTKKTAEKVSKKVEKKTVETKKVISKKRQNKEIEFTLNPKGEYFYATGKRKTAIARVRVFRDGSGKFEINGTPLEKYFFGTLISNAVEPLKMVASKKDFDATIKISGGGIAAQSDATRHGFAVALAKMNSSWRAPLKKAGFLTRDSRVKERKKPGLKRARRAPQFSKR